MRLVSLLPAATEIVAVLGLYDDLVGVTFECDVPSQARAEKAVLVGGRDTTGMSPREIDDYVREATAAGVSLYTLNADALAGLAPDLILTQDLCQVCAISTGRVDDALTYLGCDARVVSLRPHTLEDVLDTIMTVGLATGTTETGARLLTTLRKRLADLAGDGPRPRVAVIEWTDPPFGAGHWIPDLVSAAGGQPVAAHPGLPSRATTWEAIAAENPDILVVAPCGSHLDDATEQARSVATRFPSLPVWAIDADGLVVRPGPRLVEGAEALAAIIQPDRPPPDHRHARLVQSGQHGRGQTCTGNGTA